MFIVCMFTFSCRRCSSVVEHVIGNDGVASPILASGTIFDISAYVADFLFLNNYLFSPIYTILKKVNFNNLSDFLLAYSIISTYLYNFGKSPFLNLNFAP